MDRVSSELSEHVCTQSVVNTHAHHLEDDCFKEFDLATLLRCSYVDWLGAGCGGTEGDRTEYLLRVRYSSYFLWLQRAIQEIYGVRDPITASNWHDVSERIRRAHRDRDAHLSLLHRMCGYERIILDAYWNPGSDNGHPECFTPTYRVNQFFYGYDPDARDPNGGKPALGWQADNIDEYVARVRASIVQYKERGCVALKCSLAYGRGVDFKPTSRERAQIVFDRGGHPPAQEEIEAFQDYLFFAVCKIAAELNLPLQCHVGSGCLRRTGAIWLQEAIAENPGTKFVLFHCGYPWFDDLCGLVQKYPHVYPDLCWVPLISVSAAQRVLGELIDLGAAGRICWGCDTWTAEESYAALLALRHVLTSLLAARVKSGLLSLDAAKAVATGILHDNARALYGLKPDPAGSRAS